ncbi:hypothetical protein IFM89_013064 [Coptis chinensis]|uniref:Interferon-related developmental regulator N-terminal domain-containing protein n=1 Tax=Coptis chinensis TaxID=261450 RepID=A0A835HM11_9MAGN|nr:hypothetical protein IFM89_013064 [Coptis chinensis]
MRREKRTVAPRKTEIVVAPPRRKGRGECGGNSDDNGYQESSVPLGDLLKKKGAKREKALETIDELLTNSVQETFVKKWSLALLFRCLDSIQSKSVKETRLASRVVGLLSVSVGSGDRTREILEHFIPRISQVLKPDLDSSSVSSVLESLAIVTFIEGDGPEETEKSMKIIWDFLEATRSKGNTEILIAALSAWSFLLASMNSWSIRPKIWKESIPYLFSLLEEGNPSLRMVAGESLALILEIGAIDKFTNYEGHTCVERFKENFLKQVKNIMSETNDHKGSMDRDLIKSYKALFLDIRGFLKNGKRGEVSVKIGSNVLKVSMWSQFIQVNFMKRFLGSGFIKHVKDNEMFHDFFEFEPTTKQYVTEAELQMSDDSEEAGVRYVYLPDVNVESRHYQRLFESSNSMLNRAKTQFMNKQRFQSEAKHVGYYSVCFGDEENF